jgi:hypothetical protein
MLFPLIVAVRTFLGGFFFADASGGMPATSAATAATARRGRHLVACFVVIVRPRFTVMHISSGLEA